MSKDTENKIYPIRTSSRSESQPNIRVDELGKAAGSGVHESARMHVKGGSPTPESGGKRPSSVGGIVIMLILALLAISAAAVLALSLSIDFEYDYIHTITPSEAAHDKANVPSETANEADIPPPPPVYYDFTKPVAESPAVGLEYFSDTVFIGDSRTTGLIMYTNLSPYDFSSVGTNVATVQERAFIRMEDENGVLQSYTLFEALERESGNYKSIYIALGLNELGWNAERFAATFRELVGNIREITDVPIYIQLIIPVTVYAAETSKYGITNDKAVQFNEQLRIAAAELELFCLDPTKLFALEDGTLDPAHASDGIHLQISSYKILADYYATHIVDTDAYDNTRAVFGG